MSKKDFYITTPIYYVNDVPHIGSVYTTLACDVIARYKRLDNIEVKFMTGTDEHGQKIEKAALKADMEPQDFTDKMSEKFKEVFKLMNISNTDFIRTTESRHKEAAITLWKKLEENGAIYLDKYSGWYSVRDETFYNEDELIDGKAPTGTEVEWVSEESYFFKLAAYQDKLLELYTKEPNFIFPAFRKNEIVSFVKSGLKDLSISRTSFNWGIPVPGNEKHVMYVWLDALTNYLTVAGYPDINSKKFKKTWPVDVHIVGKDITRFHAVYWPAFLMAANIATPKQIVSHGWWLVEGQKMSKSSGNAINPVDLVNEFGIDTVRYYLMKEISFGHDGNFTRQGFIDLCNSELANNIGNLVQRTLTMTYKNCDGKIPQIDKDIKTLYNQETSKSDIMWLASHQKYRTLLQLAEISKKEIDDCLKLFQINRMIEQILEISATANNFIDSEAPWVLKKNGKLKEMNEVLYILAEAIRYIGILLQPFVPVSASKILDQLGVEKDERKFEHLNQKFALKPGSSIPEPQPIFPRII
jgi:methionyl-tRNA synthetase